ncbi:MAG: hypothetical protein JJU36_17455 [Phycisphaeraceae bacterium]|nr:hypothetical protein [Phycisphaeraceae bacterium]
MLIGNVTVQDGFTMAGALVILGMTLLLGKVIRRNVTLLQRLFLPTSVIAGTLGLLVGPQILGALIGRIWDEDAFLAGGLIPASVMSHWSSLPGLLISVVFAALLMGKSLPSLPSIWRQSGPQVMFGYTLAFGQYFLGFLLAILVLAPLFGLDPKVGALLEISLTGGHGTAAGLGATFEQLGFEEGRDLALGLATVGVVAGVIMGTLFINVAVRSPRITLARQEPIDQTEDFELSDLEHNDNKEQGQDDTAADPLSLHLALIGVAIALGWLLKEGLILIEAATWGRGMENPLMPLIPLFPLAMIGGVLVQLGLGLIGKPDMVNRAMINRIGGAALDIIILSAMATISLQVLGDNIGAFAAMSIVGLGWTFFAFWVLAPRMIPDRWFERGIGDMGQSCGMAVTGLLLMRISDPRNRTGAIESFGYKQLLFEPLVGGGLITALSLPLAARFGATPMLLISMVLMIVSLVGGLMLARSIRRAS